MDFGLNPPINQKKDGTTNQAYLSNLQNVATSIEKHASETQNQLNKSKKRRRFHGCIPPNTKSKENPERDKGHRETLHDCCYGCSTKQQFPHG